MGNCCQQVPLAKDKAGRMMLCDLFNNYALKEPELLLISDVSDTFFDDRDFGR